MENESDLIDTNLNETIQINDNKIFKFDYENQQFESNLNYIKWKDSNIKEYGNNAKLFKCKKCKILFYSKYEDIIKKPYYLAPCLICKQYICYFCSYSYIHPQKNRKIFCCYRRMLNISFFILGPFYGKVYYICDGNFIASLIPLYNMIMQCAFANNILFLCMAKAKSKNEGKLTTSNIEQFTPYNIISFFLYLVLSIPYTIIYTLFIIFLYLISLPFKFWLLKYYLGIFDVRDDFESIV